MGMIVVDAFRFREDRPYGPESDRPHPPILRKGVRALERATIWYNCSN